MKLYLVEWRDTSSGAGWLSLEDAQTERIAHVISVGILIDEDDEQVVLLPNHAPDHNAAVHQIAIPRGCISRMRQLKIAGS